MEFKFDSGNSNGKIYTSRGSIHLYRYSSNQLAMEILGPAGGVKHGAIFPKNSLLELRDMINNFLTQTFPE